MTRSFAGQPWDTPPTVEELDRMSASLNRYADVMAALRDSSFPWDRLLGYLVRETKDTRDRPARLRIMADLCHELADALDPPNLADEPDDEPFPRPRGVQ